MNTVSCKKFLEIETLVDIRPAHEFLKSHIPCAISLPFPIDLKRLKRVHGNSYQSIKAEQILLFVDGYEDFMQSLINKGSSLGLYCMNGGLRSLMLSKILEYPIASIQLRCGMGNRKALSRYSRNMRFLDGGLTSYLKSFYRSFELHFRFIKICGLTGSGKTQILSEIATQGGQVLDLEQLAKHSGSAFGGLTKEEQPDQWGFEQALSNSLKNFDLNRPIYFEEKGSGIGSLHIPTTLLRQFKTATSIVIEVPQHRRIENLVRTYGALPKKDLQRAISKIGGRLGKQKTQQALAALSNGKLDVCAAILLEYYDQTSVYSEQFGQKIKVSTIKETLQALLSRFEKSASPFTIESVK